MQINFMVTIVDRSLGEHVVEIFREHDVHLSLSTTGKGTASSDMLSILGFGEPEKAIIFCITVRSHAKKLMKALRNRINIDIPGPGIAFTVPVKSVCGTMTLKYFQGSYELAKEGDEKMHKPSHELIVAIANRGYTELVMEAAKAANATGGTVIHAKGTGAESAEKFFGVSLAVDKEMVFIVARSADKGNIMKSIVAGAGVNTKAKAMVFSLPVTDLVGMRQVEEDTESGLEGDGN